MSSSAHHAPSVAESSTTKHSTRGRSPGSGHTSRIVTTSPRKCQRTTTICSLTDIAAIKPGQRMSLNPLCLIPQSVHPAHPAAPLLIPPLSLRTLLSPQNLWATIIDGDLRFPVLLPRRSAVGAPIPYPPKAIANILYARNDIIWDRHAPAVQDGPLLASVFSLRRCKFLISRLLYREAHVQRRYV